MNIKDIIFNAHGVEVQEAMRVINVELKACTDKAAALSASLENFGKKSLTAEGLTPEERFQWNVTLIELEALGEKAEDLIKAYKVISKRIKGG